MKTRICIIFFLTISLLFAFAFKGHSQSIGHETDTLLLADETTLNYTKTEARINCSNDSVFMELFKSHAQLFKRFTCTWKTDRHGRYKLYSIYLSKGDAEVIIKWSKNNL